MIRHFLEELQSGDQAPITLEFGIVFLVLAKNSDNAL